MTSPNVTATNGNPGQPDRNELIARLYACLDDLDALGETIASAHLSSCIDSIKAGNNTYIRSIHRQ